MALRECGFPRQLHALSASCVIAVLVAPSAAVGPQTPSLVRILTPSPFSHRTRSRRLAPKHTLTRSKMASQDLFCHKVCFSFFPFHCHIPLLSMLWITGFHRLCLWAFPCCSPRFWFEHRLCFFFHYSGLCLLDVVLGFGWGDGGGLCPWLGAFLCMWWVHVTPSKKITQTLHHLEPLLPKNTTFMK